MVQPTVPTYRVSFFDQISDKLGPLFKVYASRQNMGVLTANRTTQEWEVPLGQVLRLLPGVEWQSGALSIPIRRGDILVVWGSARALTNIALLIKCRLKGAKTVWWGHYWSSTSKKWTANIRLGIMRLSEYLLFYTDLEVAEYLASRRDGREPNVFALNNGIDTTNIVHLRAAYKAETRLRRVLFIGRLSKKADLSTLIRSLSLPECSDIELDIIGEGVEETRMRALAQELGLGQRITWHGGLTDEARIAPIANQCQAFVYPGPVGLSLIHGLSYGLPAIVHNDRWSNGPEIAAHDEGTNGLTFTRGDAASLADCMASLLSNPERLNAMSRAAVETTRENFNTEKMAERFCHAITTIQLKDAVLDGKDERASGGSS